MNRTPMVTEAEHHGKLQAKDEEIVRLREALVRVAQHAHGAHGGRGSFRWCGETCCDIARQVLDDPA